ncbi:MAG: sensor histidine kinase [[Clostridium] scindens]
MQKCEDIEIVDETGVWARLEDLDDLRVATGWLEPVKPRQKACNCADNHSAAYETQEYMDNKVYPWYDRVSDSLTTIIDFADGKICSLNEQVQKSGITSMVFSLILAFSVIGLTILSNKQERKSIEELSRREHDLQDALYLAQQAGNAKKDFLSRMSHEIRTPMNVIVGMTTIAGANLDDKIRIKDCLSKIEFSSKHLLSLINDVLDMSKIEEGKISVNYEPFRLPQMFEAIIPAIYSQTSAKGTVFECKMTDVVSETVIGDSLRINQILLNLLSNAIKFTPAGGTICLTARQTPVKNRRTKLILIVEDTGIGMSEEFLHRLFTPFEQEDGTCYQESIAELAPGNGYHEEFNRLAGRIDPCKKQTWRRKHIYSGIAIRSSGGCYGGKRI